MEKVSLYLCGPIQASRVGDVENQDYRQQAREVIQRVNPYIEIWCPRTMHPTGGFDYPDHKKADEMLKLLDLAGTCDVLLAVLPCASLGAGAEMWEAYRHDRPIVTITPLQDNWLVLLVSTYIFPDIATFQQALRRDGALRALFTHRTIGYRNHCAEYSDDDTT